MNQAKKQLIPICDLQIPPDRQRKVFKLDELMALAESIENNQLLHAPVVREDQGVFYLVAGERRFRAIQQIYAFGRVLRYNGEQVPLGMIPYTTLGELSEVEAMEAELEENACRMNLTWQEHARAVEALKNLRIAQAEAAGLPLPTNETIARELTGSGEGSAQERVRRESILAKNLDNPAIAKARSVKEAFNILKVEERKAKHAAAAEKVGKTFEASMHTLVNADCLAWLKGAPEGQFDVILTDPMYGIDAHLFGDAGDRESGAHQVHEYDDSIEGFMFVMQQLPEELFRAAKPNAHLYLFCDIDRFDFLKRRFKEAGWRVFRTPMIWHKPQTFRMPWPDKGPRRSYETILYAMKGDKNVNHAKPDVIICDSDSDNTHTAQKPVELYRNLLARSVGPGDSVLDCFCGSGTIFPAAHSMQCVATGIELSPQHYATALVRLQALDQLAGEGEEDE